MHTEQAKAMRAGAEALKALVKPKAVMPKMTKGPSHKFSSLSFIAHTKSGKRI